MRTFRGCARRARRGFRGERRLADRRRPGGADERPPRRRGDQEPPACRRCRCPGHASGWSQRLDPGRRRPAAVEGRGFRRHGRGHGREPPDRAEPDERSQRWRPHRRGGHRGPCPGAARAHGDPDERDQDAEPDAARDLGRGGHGQGPGSHPGDHGRRGRLRDRFLHRGNAALWSRQHDADHFPRDRVGRAIAAAERLAGGPPEHAQRRGPKLHRQPPCRGPRRDSGRDGRPHARAGSDHRHAGTVRAPRLESAHREGRDLGPGDRRPHSSAWTA